MAVTRPAETADAFVDRLRGHGAACLVFPLIRIVPPSDTGPLERAAADVASFDWILFTSANGVEQFARALRDAVRSPGEARNVACVGPATADAARAAGFFVRRVATRHQSDGVVETMKAAGSLESKRVLLPRSEAGAPTLPDALQALGADVHDVPAYRPARDHAGLRGLSERVRAGGVDVVTLMSSSAAEAYADGVPQADVTFACIGPSTAATARGCGLGPIVTAVEHTGAGLVDAILAWKERALR